MADHTADADRSDRVARLDDGRAVSYAEYGAPDGRPLLLFHGTPGSRVLGELFDGVARRRGVRVLAPTRPGFGNSPSWPDRSLTDTGAFAAAVLDDAGVERARALGFSGGGPHALALAATDPTLLDGVDVVAGATPPALGPSAPLPQRLLRRTARSAPVLLDALVRVQVRVAERAPAGFVLAQYTDSAGRSSVSDAAADVVRRDFLAALRHRRAGLLRELELLGEPWGFSLDDVAVPVRLWHGADDANVPAEAARRAAAALPDCELSVYEDTDHLTTLLRSRPSVVGREPSSTDRPGTKGKDS